MIMLKADWLCKFFIGINFKLRPGVRSHTMNCWLATINVTLNSRHSRGMDLATTSR